jgi:hypothetical protein
VVEDCLIEIGERSFAFLQLGSENIKELGERYPRRAMSFMAFGEHSPEWALLGGCRGNEY